MNDWIGLGIIGAIVLLAIFFLIYLSRPYTVTPEEFEKRAQEGPGLINAGMIGLQKMLEPGAKKAIEVQEDLRAGRYNKKDQSGDPPEAGEEEEEVKSEK
ncbi:MAG TPA: hypothetical protein VN643_21995 [Pyrinomonadaceae bacterium]|nr:hypothetical protein [Pyrinomonadaceae bacterium]